MTEEFILDCSGREKAGTVTGDADARGFRGTMIKIKYDFQVIRVECRVKWKFTQASAGGDKYADLKLKCGSTKKRAIKCKQRPAKATWTLASCEKSCLQTAFALEPDGVHAIWKRKKKGTFYFKICICFLEVLTSHDIYIFQVIMWLCTTTSLLAVKWNTKK